MPQAVRVPQDTTSGLITHISSTTAIPRRAFETMEGWVSLHFLRFKDVAGQPGFLQVVSPKTDGLYETTFMKQQDANQALSLPPMIENEFSEKIRERLKAIIDGDPEIEFDPFEFLQQICKAFPEQVPYISLEASTTPDHPETGHQLCTGGYLVTADSIKSCFTSEWLSHAESEFDMEQSAKPVT